MKYINEETKLTETRFNGELLSISDKTFTNTNETEYKVVSVAFTPEGAEKPQTISGFMYMANYNRGLERGMEIGDNLLCTAINAPQGVIVIVSHLEGSANRATRDMFGFEEPDTMAVTGEEQLEAAV